MSPLVQPRIGGKIQCPEDGCTDGQYIWMFVIFILMMIGIVLVIIAGVFSCVLASKGMNFLLLINGFSVFKWRVL
jgi:hypothetical protein